MKNWHDDSVTISNECPWLGIVMTHLVAEKLGIPFQTVDLSEQYQEKIVDYMFSEYEKEDSNPDVLCNREIKFDVFMKIATLSLGADYVATGHYAKVKSKLMVKRCTNYLQVLIIIKTNLIFFVNYHKNNWLNHYFPGLTKPRST
jgi:tRNA-specific 2-thiouridylase